MRDLISKSAPYDQELERALDWGESEEAGRASRLQTWLMKLVSLAVSF